MYQTLKEIIIAFFIIWAMFYAMHSTGLQIETKVAYKAIAGGN